MNPRLAWLVAAFVSGAATAAASAQIVYLPVQYEYGAERHFYYGGTDPAVVERALEPVDAGRTWGRVDGYAFASGNEDVHREVVNEPIRVFSDAVPTQNAHLYGYTVSDAANAANASVPRYFRKSDIIAAARRTPGVLIVPAQAETPDEPADMNYTPPARSQFSSPRPTPSDTAARPHAATPAAAAPANPGPAPQHSQPTTRPAVAERG